MIIASLLAPLLIVGSSLSGNGSYAAEAATAQASLDFRIVITERLLIRLDALGNLEVESNGKGGAKMVRIQEENLTGVKRYTMSRP